MPIPFYNLATIPPGSFVPEHSEPFKVGVVFWREEGLEAIIRGVTGNGTVAGSSLVVWPDGNEMPLKEPAQTLVEVDAGLSISWNGTTPPGPDDLDNGNPLSLMTTPVVLADGNFWQIPELRGPFGTTLPRDLVRNRLTKKLETPVRKEYQDLWQESEEWFQFLFDVIEGTRTSINLDSALSFATKVIGLRYRFCDATQAALRIIDSSNVQDIIKAALGWDAVFQRIKEIATEEPQKKSESSEKPNGNSGPGD